MIKTPLKVFITILHNKGIDKNSIEQYVYKIIQPEIQDEFNNYSDQSRPGKTKYISPEITFDKYITEYYKKILNDGGDPFYISIWNNIEGYVTKFIDLLQEKSINHTLFGKSYRSEIKKIHSDIKYLLNQ